VIPISSTGRRVDDGAAYRRVAEQGRRPPGASRNPRGHQAAGGRHLPTPSPSPSPFGTVGFERGLTPKGERRIWREEGWANKLNAMRGPGEGYSDVIVRPDRGKAPPKGEYADLFGHCRRDQNLDWRDGASLGE